MAECRFKNTCITDFDALPIIEENNVEYCSQNKGVMHVRGHDAHTACLLGTLRILDILKKEGKEQSNLFFNLLKKNTLVALMIKREY